MAISRSIASLLGGCEEGSDGGYYGYDNPLPALDTYVGTTRPFVASADDATDT
jgi:hypothetical protein